MMCDVRFRCSMISEISKVTRAKATVTGAQPVLIDRFIMFARFLSGLDFPTRFMTSNATVLTKEISDGSFFDKFHLPSARIFFNPSIYLLLQTKAHSCNLFVYLFPWIFHLDMSKNYHYRIELSSLY